MLYGVYGVFQHDVFSGKETLTAQLALFPLFVCSESIRGHLPFCFCFLYSTLG